MGSVMANNAPATASRCHHIDEELRKPLSRTEPSLNCELRDIGQLKSCFVAVLVQSILPLRFMRIEPL